jgi:protein gp37
MGEASTIEWTDATFQPWIGCQRVSPGCTNCYAETFDRRVGGGVDPADGVKKLRWGPTAPRTRTSKAYWRGPVNWNKHAAAAGVRRRVFCASLADVFEDRPELVLVRRDLFELIDATPSLDWQLLTKRPENIARLMPAREVGGYEWPRLNVWLGTTIEDQQRANERVPKLLEVPAVVHFLSCEPLLEAVTLPKLRGLDWVIIGGESGGGARPFDVAWARSLVRQAVDLGAKPFVKQLGAYVRTRNDDSLICDFSEGGWNLDPGQVEEHLAGHRDDYQGAPVRVHLHDRAGGDPTEWPEDLRVREFPEAR